MFTGVRRWIPIALCCIPAVAIAAIVGLGILIGGASFGASFGGPLGLGLIVLALLVCPLHMGWMMWRMQKQQGASGHSIAAAACCTAEKLNSTAELDPPEHLQALRTQREALERELIELQGH